MSAGERINANELEKTFPFPVTDFEDSRPQTRMCFVITHKKIIFYCYGFVAVLVVYTKRKISELKCYFGAYLLSGGEETGPS